MPDVDPKPLPPVERFALRDFGTALAQILAISLVGALLAATVIRSPSCPGKEPAHAWQR